ncbi:hypothetical protein HK098_005424 [Nowakowskiella sp. JEL0407]|nr:hypothetical protein HK098_005424 [Nowakowskiella sp. JEL0407]
MLEPILNSENYVVHIYDANIHYDLIEKIIGLGFTIKFDDFERHRFVRIVRQGKLDVKLVLLNAPNVPLAELNEERDSLAKGPH